MAIKKRPVSPRQKMINLMYVVLMAMLALNVSNEVLNGFSIVEESLNCTTSGSIKENQLVYDNLDLQMRLNPTKVGEWYNKAQEVKRMSESLYNFAEELKLAIVQEADGKDGTLEDIKNKEDLEAANQVMLAPGRGRGKELFNAIGSFRKRIIGMTSDMSKQQIISANLSTSVPRYTGVQHRREGYPCEPARCVCNSQFKDDSKRRQVLCTYRDGGCRHHSGS